MITILDYQMGNLRSVAKAIEAVGGTPKITNDPKVAIRADKLLVPGVGAFRDCMAALRSQNLDQAITEFIHSGRPYLGICLGMQILMDRSFEGGEYEGLKIIPGTVQRFDSSTGLKIPHMGWNNLNVRTRSQLLQNLPENSYVYFVHSYYCKPDKNKLVAASTDYGVDFAAAIEQDNVYAVQFHPEKSQQIGLKILKTFVEKL